MDAIKFYILFKLSLERREKVTVFNFKKFRTHIVILIFTKRHHKYGCRLKKKIEFFELLFFVLE